MDLTEQGKLFQSKGALNLKVRLPTSLDIFGTAKKDAQGVSGHKLTYIGLDVASNKKDN